MIFDDREHAGRLLAPRLEHLRAEGPVVLGLVRGGVPVAREVARALGAPLDVVVVGKLGLPGSPECAVGALAEAGVVFVDRALAAETGVSEEELAELVERAAPELVRRVRAYRGGAPPPALGGRTAILVDDGVATGATARAAALAARRWGARRVVLAAPVIAAASAAELRGDFDEIVAVERPPDFLAVSWWYRRFGQVSDVEVLACLEGAREAPAAGAS
jgi:putative phosphoribosyl transferase